MTTGTNTTGAKTNWPRPPALVIFDCDGVLVDSEPITNALLAREMTEAGLPMTPEQAIESFVGGTIKSAFEHARGMGADLADDWVAGFYTRMIDALGQEVEAIPGIEAVLDRLDAAAIPCCVASNGPMRKMEVTLGRTGLWDRLSNRQSAWQSGRRDQKAGNMAGKPAGGRIFSAHDVGIAKPDPGLFLHAARVMGAPPEQCLVIEDSASGARAAQAAGMACLGFTRDTPAEKLVAHGAVPFDDMAALPALILGGAA